MNRHLIIARALMVGIALGFGAGFLIGVGLNPW